LQVSVTRKPNAANWGFLQVPRTVSAVTHNQAKSAIVGANTDNPYQRSGLSSVWRITFASTSEANARSPCTTRKTSETHKGIW
jgi:hypothetical protein